MKVSADGHGVVSHAGVGMLREVAELTGLSAQVTAALADTYRGPWVYAPGAVFADLAAAVADGADCIDGVGQLCGDREHVFGPRRRRPRCGGWSMSGSTPRICRGIRAARAHARAAAWAAGAAPAPRGWLHIDIDATITIDHSDNKQSAAATWKKTFGHHPLLAFLDRPEIAGGEALAGLLRAGQRRLQHRRRPRHGAGAGAGVAAGRPTDPSPDDPGGPTGSGALRFRRGHPRLRRRLPGAGVGFSFGYAVDARVRDAADTLNRGRRLVSGDRHRRRHPRRRLGRRSHRAGRHVGTGPPGPG